MLRIGVTGHRTFEHVDLVAREVDRVLDGLGIAGVAGVAGDTGVEVWSSLAEGADRLVADRAMARGARLVAVLPLEVADYRQDFRTEASRDDFDRLTRSADVVTVVAEAVADDRTAAYLAAGAEIVRGVDVLVALWDGAPARGRGGTAEIVELARRRGIRVDVVRVERPEVHG